jgi:hypothetical protein
MKDKLHSGSKCSGTPISPFKLGFALRQSVAECRAGVCTEAECGRVQVWVSNVLRMGQQGPKQGSRNRGRLKKGSCSDCQGLHSAVCVSGW